MTGPEHYQEAERLLALAASSKGTTYEGDNPEADRDIAAAQVHAALALAAATAVQPSNYGVQRAEWKAWAAAAGTPEGDRRS